MNIAVINFKDIVKYALKLGIIICLIYICMKLINVNSSKEQLKGLECEVQKISKSNLLQCLDISMTLFSYKKTNENKFEILSNKQILAMETGIFDKSFFEKTDLVINEEELTIDDTEELVIQIADIPEGSTTEVIEENNITAKYNTSYGNVKINNQSDYEMTEEILIPNAEITNKKDILIYHTHTCESYTPSERI